MKIAYISSYIPRKCGIATFTHNLQKAIAIHNIDESPVETMVIAVNDQSQRYHYPEEVKFVIHQEKYQDYIKAAKFINEQADVCILEHEYGIFGGDSGVFILSLLHHLKVPVMATFHTVLKTPSHIQKIIMQEICKKTEKVIVMSQRAVDFLKQIYKVPGLKIALIEHGVPEITPPKNPEDILPPAVKHKRVLLTFGLLSRNKGIETAIKALEIIVKRHPDVVYLVLGNTHPGVLRSSGETYRNELKQLAKRLKLEHHVIFINKFLDDFQLFEYLYTTDIYITPYLNEAQITSGTLSYAVGAGTAVVSTPYWHAQELLMDDRGRLFNFKDHNQLAKIVIDLLDHPEKLQLLQFNAINYSEHLKWPRIGLRYKKLAEHVLVSWKEKQEVDFPMSVAKIPPRFQLDHVLRLTDDTGIVQHAKYGIPNLKEGYCLDDNSRALIMALMAYQMHKSQEALRLLPIYLSFIQYMQNEDGTFRNFLSFSRQYLDKVGSEDSFGRTIWALGFLIDDAPDNGYREFAQNIFSHSYQHFSRLKHLRGIANTLIGIAYYMKSNPADEGMFDMMNELTNSLIESYECYKLQDQWHWFEEKMTYDNGILPLALFHSYEINNNDKVLHIARESLEFLEELTLKKTKNYLTPVGNNGWYDGNDKFPLYDQQAIETMAMVLVYEKAYDITLDPAYLDNMFSCYQWFHGENELHIPLYDPETKGCCDGLRSDGLNRNQGAESTLAYLISHMVVEDALNTIYAFDSRPISNPNESAV